ncbi:MAG TPA: hypothetical protein VN699_19920 [Pirellulales bacterium]|nr:hypothetical protein [Pirellulales bacterium]
MKVLRLTAIVSLAVLFWDVSTVHAQYGGSFLAGQGTLAAAPGRSNLDVPQAAGNYKPAYSARLANQRNRTATYFEMRRMNASYRAETRRPPPTPEELSAFNQQRTPERLEGDQIDAASGKLIWPGILRGDQFAESRAKLERLFADRTIHAYDSGLGTPNYHAIVAAVDEMHAQLKATLFAWKPDEYIAGQKFLKSLAFEARFAPGAAAADLHGTG